jgi:hypothetical protein
VYCEKIDIKTDIKILLLEHGYKSFRQWALNKKFNVRSVLNAIQMLEAKRPLRKNGRVRAKILHSLSETIGKDLIMTEESEKYENLTPPPHYYQREIKGRQIQVFDICSAWLENLPGMQTHHLSSAVEYILRAPHKGQYYSDLAKAVSHLQECLKEEQNDSY